MRVLQPRLLLARHIRLVVTVVRDSRKPCGGHHQGRPAINRGVAIETDWAAAAGGGRHAAARRCLNGSVARGTPGVCAWHPQRMWVAAARAVGPHLSRRLGALPWGPGATAAPLRRATAAPRPACAGAPRRACIAPSQTLADGWRAVGEVTACQRLGSTHWRCGQATAAGRGPDSLSPKRPSWTPARPRAARAPPSHAARTGCLQHCHWQSCKPGPALNGPTARLETLCARCDACAARPPSRTGRAHATGPELRQSSSPGGHVQAAAPPPAPPPCTQRRAARLPSASSSSSGSRGTAPQQRQQQMAAGAALRLLNRGWRRARRR